MATASNSKKNSSGQSTGDRPSPTTNQPLPFEPQANKKTKAPKLVKSQSKPEKQGTSQGNAKPKASAKGAKTSAHRSAIPEVVSKRMARRMAFFCGIPTLIGFSVLPASYWVITHHWFDLPNTAVLLMSLGCLGLSVLGLSYGVLSASWDEDREGSLLGFREFSLNWDRFMASWKNRRQQ